MNRYLLLLLAGPLLLIHSLFRPELAPADAPGTSSASYIPICGDTYSAGIPASVLRQSLRVRAGLGAVSVPTSTTSPEAQAYFEQGMAYLHGYALVEAARSFHQALRADSALAMAYVGLSRVYSQLENRADAKQAANQAKALEATLTPREKAHIRVRFSQLKALDSLSNERLLLAYRADLHTAIRQHPTDAELWLLLGNAHERYASGRGQGSTTASIAIYEKVLRLMPDHPAAHHYLIHAQEGMMNYEQALFHGEAYARLAPNLAHARHMYAHDLMKTGRIDSAVAELTRADATELAIFRADGYKPDYDWHHTHNLSLLALCFQYKGQLGEAGQALRRVSGMNNVNPEWSFYNKRAYPDWLVATNRADEARPLITAMTQANTAAERLMGHYLLGRVALSRGDLAQARTHQQATETELATIKKKPMNERMVSWVGTFPPFLNILIRLSDPAIQATATESVRAFQRTAREQYGPDPWAEALFQLEAIAQVAHRQGLTTLADESIRVLAEHDPNYPGTHYLLAQQAHRRGDAATAQRELTLARQGWQQADVDVQKRILLN
jgi:tetratricopeptide (TPR) repeat protein